MITRIRHTGAQWARCLWRRYCDRAIGVRYRGVKSRLRIITKPWGYKE